MMMWFENQLEIARWDVQRVNGDQIDWRNVLAFFWSIIWISFRLLASLNIFFFEQKSNGSNDARAHLVARVSIVEPKHDAHNVYTVSVICWTQFLFSLLFTFSFRRFRSHLRMKMLPLVIIIIISRVIVSIVYITLNSHGTRYLIPTEMMKILQNRTENMINQKNFSQDRGIEISSSLEIINDNPFISIQFSYSFLHFSHQIECNCLWAKCLRL